MELSNYEGKWAVITGASSGIGAEFARQLADEGMNVALVARRKEKLEALADEINHEYGVKTKVIVQDMTDKDAAENIDTAMGKSDVRIFVSNAGFAKMGPIDTIDLADYENMVDLNVLSHLRIGHLYGRKFKKQKDGGIVFTSSMVGLQGVAYASNYSAAKAYVLNFGESLHHELKKDGVHVSVLAPGATDTEMINDFEEMDFSSLPMKFMSPSKAVRASLDALEDGKPLVVPGAMNKFQVWMTNKLFTRNIGSKIWSSIMRRMIKAS